MRKTGFLAIPPTLRQTSVRSCNRVARTAKLREAGQVQRHEKTAGPMLAGQRVPDDSNYRRLLVFEFWHKTRNCPKQRARVNGVV